MMPGPDQIATLMGSMRPSERRVLLTVAMHDNERFVLGLESFLAGWSASSWLDEYSIGIVGRWIGRTCPSAAVDASAALAHKALCDDRPDHKHHKATYRVFLAGLQPPC